jgi:2-phosphosulfolactate phosphatase
MPLIHFIEGEAGCRFARDNGCSAVVVDALRASATAAALLHAGASRLLVTLEVEEARAARAAWPQALLFGERGGLPPEGFDYGNSPAEALHAAGRDVIFTTTTGAGRMVQCWGAPCVLMGTTVNAGAVSAALEREARDVVIIPAGLMTDPAFDAQEDRVAAAYLAMRLSWPLGEGSEHCTHWMGRVRAEGLEALFQSAPHAQALRDLGMQADIPLCAAVDTHPVAPVAIAKMGPAVQCATYL